MTEPFGFTPPPQHESLFEQLVPVSRQPLAGKQTVAPEPGSKQVREQQLLPPEQGLPACVQPPPPPPVMERQTPAPASCTLHALPQHSAFVPHRSPFGWQK